MIFVKKYLINVVSMYITPCHFIRFVAGSEWKCLVDWGDDWTSGKGVYPFNQI